MKIIPKKIKIKNTIWKCYSLIELIIIVFILIIVAMMFMKNQIIAPIIMLVLTIIMFMPVTNDDLFYTILIEMISYVVKPKKLNISSVYNIKNITKDGFIEYDNNCFSKVLKIEQKNFFLEDTETQESDILCINKALKQLEMNVKASIVKIDQPINFDDYIKDLDERIKNIQEQYTDTKEQILRERKKYLEQLNSSKKQYISNYYLVIYSNNKQELLNIIENTNLEIKKSGLNTKYLDKIETAIFLKYNNHHNFDEREAYTLNDKQLIDWVKPKNLYCYSNKCLIENVETSILTVFEYPLKVNNAWANEIFNIPNTKVVMNINQVEKNKAIRKIDRCILEMETKELLKEKASEMNASEIHRKTMFNLLNSLQAEEENLLDVTINIIGYNYNNDLDYKKKIKRIINGNGFKITNLFCKQKEGFLSTNLSFNNQLIKYNRSINSKSLAAFFPFVKNYVMDNKGIVLGSNINNNYPFIFDLWKRGDIYQNSNAFVIGNSGSGKTFFLKTLIINEWSNDTRVIICDPEAEYHTLTKKLSGNIIDVGNAKQGVINPFHIYKILTENGIPASPSVVFNAHLKTLESFFKIVLPNIDNEVMELINLLTIEAYKFKGITELTDCSDYEPHKFPIFADVLYILNQKLNTCKDEFMKHKYLIAKLHLDKFVNGRYSDIWNNPSTLEIDSKIIDFDFQSLFASKNNVIANAQMLLIFRFIEQEIINNREINKGYNKQKTLIIVDEAHVYIDAKYPIALDFFYQMNKRIRKYNGAFIPATQNISDWNSNEELRYKTSTIIKNSQYNFIFKLSSPDMQDVLDLYKAGNSFNKEERMLIISSARGQAFFVGANDVRSAIKIQTNDYVKQLFCDEEKE